MNTKLHAVSDANGRPLSFFMTAGQVSDYTGAAALLDDLPPQPFQRCFALPKPWAAPPKAQWLLGDCGYDPDWFAGRLAGQGHPALHSRAVAAQQGAFVRADRFHATLERQMMMAALSPVSLSGERGKWRFWLAGDIGQSRFDGDGAPGIATTRFTNRGMSGGINRDVGQAGTVGIALGYGRSDVDVPDRATTGHVDAFHVGGFASVGSVRGAYLQASVSYDKYGNKLTRSVAIGGPNPLSGTTTADFDGNGVSGRAEVGFRASLGSVQLTPFAGIHYSSLNSDGFSESGSSPFNLFAQGEKAKSAPGSIGLQVNSAPGTGVVRFWLRGALRHEFERDRQLTVGFLGTPGAPFTVLGAIPAENYGAFSGGVDISAGHGLSFFGVADGAAGAGKGAYNVQVGARLRF